MASRGVGGDFSFLSSSFFLSAGSGLEESAPICEHVCARSARGDFLASSWNREKNREVTHLWEEAGHGSPWRRRSPKTQKRLSPKCDVSWLASHRVPKPADGGLPWWVVETGNPVVNIDYCLQSTSLWTREPPLAQYFCEHCILQKKIIPINTRAQGGTNPMSQHGGVSTGTEQLVGRVSWRLPGRDVTVCTRDVVADTRRLTSDPRLATRRTTT